MDAHYLPAFDQAMQFLFERHGNSISEDLVQAYCACGYLQDAGGVLTLTDAGRAELRRRRRRPVATN